ncbi:MAG: hypothetical protein ACOCXA_04000, partial [Planctomycetota bacterium]
MKTIISIALLALPVASIHSAAIDLHQEAQRLWHAALLAHNDDAVRRSWGKTISDRAYHPQAGLREEDRGPCDVILRRTHALLEDLRSRHPDLDLAAEAAELAELAQQVQAGQPQWVEGTLALSFHQKKHSGMDINREQEVSGQILANNDERFALFERIFLLQRRIAFANPLLDFDRILFVKKHPALVSHMIDQYFGRAQVPGGGVFILENAFSDQPTAVDVLADATCQNGRLEGQALQPGAFLSPELSYDGSTIYFAYSQVQDWFGKGVAEANDGKLSFRSRDMPPYVATPEWAFHLFSVAVDGSNLRMLTDGPWNDFDPCVLPSGRIAFISERCGGEGRCHPRPCPTYVLHSMLPDGSDIVPLSYHETNEWNPSVTNDGEIAYSRWDYVDREVGGGQHPWITKPDGRDARALHGNYDEGKLAGGEYDPMAIPGTTKFVGTLSGHHAMAYGPLSVFDTSISELSNEKEMIRHLTPEAAGDYSASAYATPWPLSERYFLVAYSPQSRCLAGPSYKMIPYEQPVQHGLYLLDCFGNRQLLYRDETIGSQSPIPLRAREKPVIIPHQTAVGYPPGQEPADAGNVPETTEVTIADVYQSLKPWPEDRSIASLRVVQLFPKQEPFQDNPPIGHASMGNARTSLGTVPVEADGSAYFTMPARMPVYFQVLDEDGLAIQSMMTSIYGHPGERLQCVGCHEPPSQVTAPMANLPATKRPPSQLEPEVPGGGILTFPHHIQPILSTKCQPCHQKEGK